MVPRHGLWPQNNRNVLTATTLTCSEESKISSGLSMQPSKPSMRSYQELPSKLIQRRVRFVGHCYRADQEIIFRYCSGQLLGKTTLTNSPILASSPGTLDTKPKIFLWPWLTVRCGEKLCSHFRPRPQDDDDDALYDRYVIIYLFFISLLLTYVS